MAREGGDGGGVGLRVGALVVFFLSLCISGYRCGRPVSWDDLPLLAPPLPAFVVYCRALASCTVTVEGRPFEARTREASAEGAGRFSECVCGRMPRGSLGSIRCHHPTAMTNKQQRLYAVVRQDRHRGGLRSRLLEHGAPPGVLSGLPRRQRPSGRRHAQDDDGGNRGSVASCGAMPRGGRGRGGGTGRASNPRRRPEGKDWAGWGACPTTEGWVLGGWRGLVRVEARSLAAHPDLRLPAVAPSSRSGMPPPCRPPRLRPPVGRERHPHCDLSPCR